MTQCVRITVKPQEKQAEPSKKNQEQSWFVQFSEVIQAPKVYVDEANGNEKLFCEDMGKLKKLLGRERKSQV